MRTYNTGKVQIGLAYQRPNRVPHDKDATRLQDALLGNKRSVDKDGIFIAAVVTIVIVGILAHFWSTL